jgi:hypothetical protein
MVIRPMHDDETADDAGEVPGREVAPEGRHRAEEYGTVPEMEFCAGELLVEHEEEDGG